MRRIKLVLAVAAAIAVMVVAAAPAMADVVRFDGDDHARFNNFDANNGLTIFFTSSSFGTGDFDDGSFILSTPDFHFDFD